MARPRKEINWDDVSKLSALQCTQEEIASFCEVSLDTLERRCEEATGVSFAEFFEQKRRNGRISLRRKQYEVAQKGNVPLLIWLGKQYLGQSEKAVEQLHSVNVNTAPLTTDDLIQLLDASRVKKAEGES